MATLVQDYTLANDAAFKQAVQSAMLRQVNIWLRDGTLNGNFSQLTTARDIYYEPELWVKRVAYATAAESTVQATNGVQPSDTVIATAVTAVLARFVR